MPSPAGVSATTDRHNNNQNVCFVLFFILEKIERTVQIEASTVEIEERGVKLRLTVVDTPGYGDAINSQDWYVCRYYFA